MFSNVKDMHEADIVITIKRGGLMTIIKNRNGIQPLRVDLAGLLEIIKPYQIRGLNILIDSWIGKVKNYRAFL